MFEVSAREAMIFAVDGTAELPAIEDGQIKRGRPLCVQTTTYIDYHVSDRVEAGFPKKPVRMLV